MGGTEKGTEKEKEKRKEPEEGVVVEVRKPLAEEERVASQVASLPHIVAEVE